MSKATNVIFYFLLRLQRDVLPRDENGWEKGLAVFKHIFLREKKNRIEKRRSGKWYQLGK